MEKLLIMWMEAQTQKHVPQLNEDRSKGKKFVCEPEGKNVLKECRPLLKAVVVFLG
jgi:hypothetical protein